MHISVLKEEQLVRARSGLVMPVSWMLGIERDGCGDVTVRREAAAVESQVSEFVSGGGG